jgi:diaminohydroxyphosphoribosylaminopyrimidine deaminase/5-amino-6-(5-phosphoribosylamino)uracil reductase
VEVAAKFLELACEKAWEYQGITYPNPAVGAVVVKNGCVISCEAHKKAGEPHAEVEALKSAFLILSENIEQKTTLSKLQTSHEIHNFLEKNAAGLFGKCDIYVTLEPCSHEGRTPSCAKLLSLLKPQKVVIGVKELNDEASGGGRIIEKCGIETIFVQNESCEELIEPFRLWKKGSFIFFKLALTMNGKITGGKISCDSSFYITHILRDKIDLLAVGGNTVRMDRPTLDARLINGRAPNILVYSKTDNFVRDIPLFNVKNRKVTISSSIDEINKYNFVMIEGGRGMLEATKNIASHYLFFISSKMFGHGDLDGLDLSFKILHSRKIDEDLLIWARRN